ncbi:MAG: hypothetical protein A3G33_01610 [Omnitrophica bacterium RIFCSPLOWO2_12_FULL_44_17]|uniref:Serine aminopeptidase S33 domain-containing protein n=1 Tax=Candidatus Danuiimicrobium aquiferis TaxID=1801832 RepID=A0A1G1KV95_9BACT|nr:MAG: hypothetical protein A3B72_00845 [Omnitrophica bacterium RIFCSPHIGHO2_02_FULL_45_28]OGW92506.1 MAG: hypothetical protein A3E74_09305 [Omnitrophica bacterium RIFCSPHIGHO2_12_FULL_44_12]OGW96811.1 MAG: hypothetical protein A3G33_01610 [Omnitrophica bacterium RIFCSPLOWO2_12_FULL_44_17]OGX03813.1 MAG: hypothetical protein A3J12_09500 [Omnitrophica bacterium RIFCSPLOWO2_02_FULL_44_11]
MIISMLFFPSKEFTTGPSDFGLVSEDMWCQTEDRVKIHGWYLPALQSEKCLLFFHGNAGNISIRLPKAKEWVSRGVSVLLMDYRGYGKSEGNIKGGKDLFCDTRAALSWLVKEKKIDPSKIVLYGESIGSVFAIQLATEQKFHAIILEAPFTSVKKIGEVHYGIVPDFILGDFKLYNNETAISKVQCPVFLVQGTDDEIVPPAMGKLIFENAPQPKEMLAVPSGHHNDLPDVAGKDFFEKPLNFISNLAPSSQ